MSMRTGTRPRHSAIPGSESSRKVLSVLLSFSQERHTQTVQELAEVLDAPVSSVYRYVGLLREFGLLEEAEFGGYRVSLLVNGLARAASAGSAGLRERARPLLERLVEQTGETALLVRPLGQAAVAVDIEESRNPVRLRFERGVLMPLHQGAGPRVLLAALPPRERAAYYSALSTVVDSTEPPTADQLDIIAAAGWTESFGQIEDGIWGTASSVRLDNRVVAALSVAGPLYRLDEKKRSLVIRAVRDTAAELNATIGNDLL